MNTDFSNHAEAASTQAKVFYKIGILTEIRFAAENIHNDFTHPGDNLIVCPSRNGGGGKISLVRHRPTSEVADGLQIGWKFLAQRLGQAQGGTSSKHSDENKYPNGNGIYHFPMHQPAR